MDFTNFTPGNISTGASLDCAHMGEIRLSDWIITKKNRKWKMPKCKVGFISTLAFPAEPMSLSHLRQNTGLASGSRWHVWQIAYHRRGKNCCVLLQRHKRAKYKPGLNLSGPSSTAGGLQIKLERLLILPTENWFSLFLNIQNLPLYYKLVMVWSQVHDLYRHVKASFTKSPKISEKPDNFELLIPEKKNPGLKKKA